MLALEQVRSDGSIVAGCEIESLASQRKSRLKRKTNRIPFQFLQYPVIVSRVDDNSHIPEVFRRRADHRGSTDFDILDYLVELDPRFRSRFFKGIEVDDHEVDWADLLLGHLPLMAWVFSDSEQSTMH